MLLPFFHFAGVFMASVNRVTLLGNLGTDPEVRRTSKQTAVCRFRLATSARRKDAGGNWSEYAEWHNVVTFGKTAESCGTFLRKGRQVFVEGSLRTRSWQDSDGQTRHATGVVANNVQFIGGKGAADASASPGNGRGTEEDVPALPEETDPIPGFDEEDIPF
jgi:single-strand DNA-binding protein